VQLTLAVAIAPALFLLWVFQRLDSKRPEPPGSVRNVVLLGIGSCIPAALIELAMSAALGDVTHAGGRFLDAFLIAGFTEETLKLACVLVYLWRKPHFDEVMDGILYTAAASLGFALLENILYAGGNLAIGILRALTAVPMHALASGLMGYFVGRARFARGAAAGWIVGGLTVAVGIHGFYDWALMSQGGYGVAPSDVGLMLLGVAGTLVLSAALLFGAYRHALHLDDALLGPHARPLESPQTGAPTPSSTPLPYAGMPVQVLWSDGATYSATLLGGQGGHFLCELGPGRAEWVPRERVWPAQA